MWTKWTVRSAATVACAVLLAACGGNAGDNRRAQGSDRGAGQAAAALVALSGCLEAAPGTNQYVLRNVRFEPRAGDPHASTTTSGGHGITEGAWVRLDGGTHDLTGHLGQRVMLKGTIADDGRNTIGTAGAPGVPAPSGDTSQAASREHHSDKVKQEMGRIGRESMADGTAARVRVAEVSASGDRCAQPEGGR